MNISLRISLIIALVIYFACIYAMLKKGRLGLKYSLLWIFSGILMLIFVLFPSILEQLAQWLGIMNYLNGLFSVLIFGLMILLMFLTTIVSDLSSRNSLLVQECALLDERIRVLEKAREDKESA